MSVGHLFQPGIQFRLCRAQYRRVTVVSGHSGVGSVGLKRLARWARSSQD